ncbi:unnamed protein product [Urochloa decumbens]|uniref:Protein kinase domain-containing protein n=1 Tax=Urochloa decumbens TaxID=240449 RepID=A0ABC9ARI6_9POAL
MMSPTYAATALLVMVLQLPAAAATAGPSGAPIGLSGCKTTCGNMSVPYPFGISPGCHWPGLNLTCDKSHDPPRLLLGDGTLRVTDISMRNGTVRVIRRGFIINTTDDLPYPGRNVSFGLGFKEYGYLLSYRNEFVVSGCNVAVILLAELVEASTMKTLSGCATICPKIEDNDGGEIYRWPFNSCTKPITRTSRPDVVQAKWLYSERHKMEADQPLSVLVAEEGWVDKLEGDTYYHEVEAPLLLEWEIITGNMPPLYGNCSEGLRRMICKSEHSSCSPKIAGYVCECNDGYDGNPYLPRGCQAPMAAPAEQIGLPNCRTSCGGVRVPYPFGISPGCYRPGFNLICNTSYSPPLLFLDSNNAFRVVDIFIQDTTVRVTSKPFYTNSIYKICDNESFSYQFEGIGEPYILSTRNEFVLYASGEDAQATMHGEYRNGSTADSIMADCISTCSSVQAGDHDAGMAHGHHCSSHDGLCHTPITTGTTPKKVELKCLNLRTKHENVAQWEPNGENYALTFISEEGLSDHWYMILNKSGSGLLDNMAPPLVLRWAVKQNLSTVDDSDHCPGDVASSLCRSEHSDCRQENGGFTCHCSTGYDGNPYITNGCQGLVIALSVAFGPGILLLVPGVVLVRRKIKQQKIKLLKQKHFKQNRGQLLQQLVSQKADIAERMIIPVDELAKATNNFDKARELGGGGHGTVYKGILSDLHVVAIKKSKISVQKEIDGFINETEVPLLVYEFISNGTLYHHLHKEGPRSLSWGNRLRIATEIASSLAYLHLAVSISIIHRDIKSSNVLLDDTLTAKVSDFGASRYIPIDRTGLTTRVQGIIGYLDPMYFYTGRLTEKSDVYSFGVILVELLTRKNPVSYLSIEGDGLISHFVNLLAEGNLAQIIDPQVTEEGGEGIHEVAALAASCINLKGEERPTMRQVEHTLDGIRGSMMHKKDDMVAVGFESDSTVINSRTSTKEGQQFQESSRRYSLEQEMTMSSRYPR